MSHCIAVKELIEENPSFDNLNTIRELFVEFANKTYEIQSALHNKINSFEDLINSKPKICKNKQQINRLASSFKSFEVVMPSFFDGLQKSYNEIEHSVNQRGIADWVCDKLCVEIPDYTSRIKASSANIIRGIMSNAVDSVDKMGFVVTDLLGKQVTY